MRLFLLISFFAISSIASAQILEYNSSLKFDETSVNYFSESPEGNNTFIGIQHKGDLTDYCLEYDSGDQFASSIISVSQDEILYGFSFTSEAPIEVKSIYTSQVDTNSFFSLEGSGEINFHAFNNEIYSFNFPDTIGTAPVVFIQGILDSVFSGYITCGSNPIQHTYTNNENFYAAGTFTNSLSYTSPSGIETVISGDMTNGAYIIKMDIDGEYVDAYTFDALSFTFLRNFIPIEDDLFLITQDRIFDSRVAIVDFDDENIVYDNTFQGINIYDFKFNDDDEAYMCGHYSNGGTQTNMNLALDSNEEFLLEDANDLDGFLIKYDENGIAIWSQAIRGGNIDTYTSLSIDSEGSVYTTGCIQSKGIFDQEGENEVSFSASGLEDVFIAKYDILGNLKFANTMGGNSTDIGQKINIVEEDVVEVFGVFRNDMDVDFDTESEVILSQENFNNDFSFFLSKYNFSTVSTESVNLLEKPILYPTTASSMIRLKDLSHSIFAIYDLSGTLVKSVGHHNADVSDLANGMYIASIKTTKGFRSAKFNVIH